MGDRNDRGWLPRQKAWTILETPFSSPSKEQYPYCCPRAILLAVSVSPGLPAEAEPGSTGVSSLVCILMASSSLAPSPQTTITPLQPKRKLSSSTLPPHPTAAFLAFTPNFLPRCSRFLTFFLPAPAGIWLPSLLLSPKPWPPPNYRAQGLLLQALASGFLSALFYTTATRTLLLETLASFLALTIPHKCFLLPQGGLRSPGPSQFQTWWSCLLLGPPG